MCFANLREIKKNFHCIQIPIPESYSLEKRKAENDKIAKSQHQQELNTTTLAKIRL